MTRTNNKIWQECKGGSYIIYSEDRRLVTEIKRRKSLAEVAEMAEFFKPGKATPFAWQLRFPANCLQAVHKLIAA